jgi:hypothetical protein
MNHTDHLNRPRFPGVGDHVRIEVPKAIFPAEEFIMVVADTGRERQGPETFIEFVPETLGGVRVVLGDVEKNFLQIAAGLRSEKKGPLH